MIAMDTKKLVAKARNSGKGDWFSPYKQEAFQMAEINKVQIEDIVRRVLSNIDNTPPQRRRRTKVTAPPHITDALLSASIPI